MIADASATQRRLLVVQYAGDFAEAWHRLRQKGPETYFAQAYSVDAIADIAERGDEVAVLVALTSVAYRQTLTARLTAIGLGKSGGSDVESAILAFAAEFRPTHLLVRAPLVRLIRWAATTRVRTLVTLADSFGGGLLAWLRGKRLSRLLNRPAIEWVANHGIPASAALVKMGVDAGKVVPWDWPHANSPESSSVKQLNPGLQTIRALYVGSRIEAKGVGDALSAMAILSAKGIDIHFDVIGDGDDFSPLAAELSITDRVSFRGRVANEAIVAEMRAADVVLVPSRKDYPEGFPLTIYEALCARTPIVASTHPMFVRQLRADHSAVLFAAGDAAALAAAIERLFASPELYRALSAASSATWQGLQIPVKWADLVQRWFDGGTDATAWIRRHAWDRYRYL